VLALPAELEQGRKGTALGKPSAPAGPLPSGWARYLGGSGVGSPRRLIPAEFGLSIPRCLEHFELLRHRLERQVELL